MFDGAFWKLSPNQRDRLKVRTDEFLGRLVWSSGLLERINQVPLDFQPRSDSRWSKPAAGLAPVWS